MSACQNCGWRPARATVALCVPCWRYERRTGRPRPAEVVRRHLDRTVEREVLANHSA